MALSGAEIPGSREGDNETLPTITKLNRGLYRVYLYSITAGFWKDTGAWA